MKYLFEGKLILGSLETAMAERQELIGCEVNILQHISNIPREYIGGR